MSHENSHFFQKPEKPEIPDAPEIPDNEAILAAQKKVHDKEQAMAIGQLDAIGAVDKAANVLENIADGDDPTAIAHVVTNGLPIMASDLGTLDGKTEVRIGMMPMVDADGATVGHVNAFRFSREVPDPRTGEPKEAYGWVPLHNPYFPGAPNNADFTANDARLFDACLDGLDELHDSGLVPDMTRDMTAIGRAPDQPFQLLTAEDLGPGKP